MTDGLHSSSRLGLLARRWDGVRRAAASLLSITWLRELLTAVLLAVVIIAFLYQPVKVEGTSMAPGLEDQERVFINKFAYHFRPIERGDIIVFRYPRDLSKSFIKRVVGLPGETIEIRAGRVYVNGAELQEVYLQEEPGERQSSPPITLPPEHFYVLGDHRSSSNDSRSWGPVHRRYIYGKAVFIYWPLERMGSVTRSGEIAR